MRGMDAKKVIEILGGCQQVANILNECGPAFHTRQRVFNWHKKGAIPPWAILAYQKVWSKAERLLRKR